MEVGASAFQRNTPTGDKGRDFAWKINRNPLASGKIPLSSLKDHHLCKIGSCESITRHKLSIYEFDAQLNVLVLVDSCALYNVDQEQRTEHHPFEWLPWINIRPIQSVNVHDGQLIAIKFMTGISVQSFIGQRGQDEWSGGWINASELHFVPATACRWWRRWWCWDEELINCTENNLSRGASLPTSQYQRESHHFRPHWLFVFPDSL